MTTARNSAGVLLFVRPILFAALSLFLAAAGAGALRAGFPDCGNGVIDSGEDCDDSGPCCQQCLFAPGGTFCRLSFNSCDAQDSCTGASSECRDTYQPAGVPCRFTNDVCGISESCDGSSPACPPDVSQPDGTPCDAGCATCQSGTCTGPPGGQAPLCTPAPLGMVSWWPGEGTGEDIRDGNDGTLEDGVGFAAGKVGQAFDFDGDDDRVDVPFAPNLSPTGDELTLDGWIRPEANVSGTIYFGRSATSNHPYMMFFAGTEIVVAIRAGGAGYEFGTGFAPPLNVWTHIAMVYTGSALKFYANAVEISSDPASGNLDASNLDFAIGNRAQDVLVTSFDGQIDEVELFARALSREELQAIVDACTSGKCPPCTTAADCDDGNVCTTDSCDSERICRRIPVPEGTSCSDGDDCNGNELCYGGTCSVTPHPVCTPFQPTVGGAAPDDSVIDDWDESRPFTLHAWLPKRAALAESGSILAEASAIEARTGPAGGKAGANGGVIALIPDSDGTFRVQASWDVAGRRPLTLVSGVMPLDDATHVALTYEPTGSDNVRLYVNGSQVATATVLADSSESEGPVAVPSHSILTLRVRDAVAEANALDHALSPEQVRALHAAGLLGGCSGDCGDGRVDAQERCDDGNQIDGDCCSAQCQFEAEGSGCPDNGNPCTSDACNGAGSCVRDCLELPCDDGDACTIEDACAEGTCTGPVLVCDDGNPCTDDSCDSALGCVYVPDDTNECSDGNACTAPDVCRNGNCVCAAACPLNSATFTQDTPVAIPSGPAVATSTLVVSGVDPYLQELQLTTFLTHTFSADLDITLQSPFGTVVTLTTDNGGVNDNNYNGTFWFDKANPLGQVPYASNAGLVTDHPYVNNVVATPLVPEENFAAFVGEDPNGTWTITISDDAAGDSGTLASWTLGVRTLGTPPASSTVLFSNPTPVPIADLTVASSTILVAGTGIRLDKVRVGTFLTHTFSADLDITLESPAGTVVTLTTDNGGGSDNVFNSTAWDDDANPAGQVPYVTNPGLVTDHPYVNLVPAGLIAPEEAFGAFRGEDPTGTWTLRVSDDLASDTGSLNTWQLEITTIECGNCDVICDDGSACTTDSCDTATGCVYTPIVCDDGNACTDDACNPATGCTTTPTVCDDFIDCTDDFCNESTGCYATPDDTNECSDGTVCTTADHCVNGACVGTPVVCDDGIPCTDDFCHEISGCFATPDDTNPCSDRDECTTGDHCEAGACGGTFRVCNDGNPCTDDSCNPATGCVATRDDSNLCSDGNACTSGDHCSDSACVGTTVMCNDNKKCTTDTCNPSSGCVYTPVVCQAQDSCHSAGTCSPSTGLCSNPTRPNGSSCNDGNACTRTDKCHSGTCSGSNPVKCTAQDSCHSAGVCNPASGTCSNPNKPDGTTCSDGNACTRPDTCTGGACSGAPVTCSASDSCRNPGTCNPSTGVCSNPSKPDGAVCDDYNLCTRSDACKYGACKGDDPVPCVASDSCHSVGTCNPASGVCSNPNKPEGASCNDGNACTPTDTCRQGQCQGSGTPRCPVGALQGDATVRQSNPNTAYGGFSDLQVRFSTPTYALLKFNVSGLGGQTVTGAAVRLIVKSASAPFGGSIHPVNCNWYESSVTWNSKPPLGPVLDTVGAVAQGQVAEFDVSSAVTGEGLVCFAIDNPVAGEVLYYSREVTTLKAKLVLEVGCACTP